MPHRVLPQLDPHIRPSGRFRRVDVPDMRGMPEVAVSVVELAARDLMRVVAVGLRRMAAMPVPGQVVPVVMAAVNMTHVVPLVPGGVAVVLQVPFVYGVPPVLQVMVAAMKVRRAPVMCQRSSPLDVPADMVVGMSVVVVPGVSAVLCGGAAVSTPAGHYAIAGRTYGSSASSTRYGIPGNIPTVDSGS